MNKIERHPVGIKGKARVRCNQWDNWSGYIGRRKVFELGCCSEKDAQEWLDKQNEIQNRKTAAASGMRCNPDNVAYWVPHLAEVGTLTVAAKEIKILEWQIHGLKRQLGEQRRALRDRVFNLYTADEVKDAMRQHFVGIANQLKMPAGSQQRYDYLEGKEALLARLTK